jgi:hypothetical protein
MSEAKLKINSKLILKTQSIIVKTNRIVYYLICHLIIDFVERVFSKMVAIEVVDKVFDPLADRAMSEDPFA